MDAARLRRLECPVDAIAGALLAALARAAFASDARVEVRDHPLLSLDAPLRRMAALGRRVTLARGVDAKAAVGGAGEAARARDRGNGEKTQRRHDGRGR